MTTNLAPLVLNEAVLSLWRANPDGTVLTSQPVFLGAPANRLAITERLGEQLLAASGDRYQTAHHVDEEHGIEVARTFVLKRIGGGAAGAIPSVVRLERNQTYVLDVVWAAQAIGRRLDWYRRVYYGVTWRSHDLTSNGAHEFDHPQVFRAQYYLTNVGSDLRGFAPTTHPPTPPVIYTPTPGAAGEVVPVGFFRDTPLVVGEYLLGFYRWETAVQVLGAEVISGMPNGAPCVLGLEIDGVVSLAQLTIPYDSGYAGGFPLEHEVSASATYGGVIVPAGASVRWKVLSGPEPENAAGLCAVMMQVQPVG